jgi:2,5-furandicarboxylate decarboxylase 1
MLQRKPKEETMKDFRTFLEDYSGLYPQEVIRIDKPVDHKWVASAIATKVDLAFKTVPVLIFEKVIMADGEISPYPSVVNLLSSRKRCAWAIGAGFEKMGIELSTKLRKKTKPIVVSKTEAPVKEIVKKGEDVDLGVFPALVQHAWDPGPYITAGFLTCFDPDSGIDNCALQRGWIAGKREVRVGLGTWSHNGIIFSKYEKAKKDMRAAFWIGHHLAAYLGSEAKLGFPESHYESAGGVLGEPMRLVPSETLGEDFLVPADAEVVIEGFFPHGKRLPEAPFGEHLGYFGGQKWHPYMEVSCITHRKRPYWLTILCGHLDEKEGIGGARREGSVYDMVKKAVPVVTNVYRPASCPTHIYIQMRKTHDAQPRHAILAAISSAEGIKHVFVFDEDINIFDESEILWAIGTRSQWDKDLIVVPNCASAGLDPSCEHEGISTRGGIDCTKPAPPEVFEQRTFIPEEIMSKVSLEDYLPREILAGGARGA